MTTMQLMEAMEIPNNYRRMHGQKPMRWKHIWNARNKRVTRALKATKQLSRAIVLCARGFGKTGTAVKRLFDYLDSTGYSERPYVGIDLGDGPDCSSSISYCDPSKLFLNRVYGTKLIQTERIVKIDTKGE